MHLLALRLGFAHLGRKKLARATVVAAVAGLLLMLGILWMFQRSLGDVSARLGGSARLTVFIHPDASDGAAAAALSAVRKTPGVKDAELVTREDFTKRFSSLFPAGGGDLAQLDPEAVPRYLRVEAELSRAASVRTALQRAAGVESVETTTQRLGGVMQALSGLRGLIVFLIGALGLALGAVLINHFRLSTQMAHQMRVTLSSLGAKPSARLLPFLVEGVAEGGAAGFLAAASLMAFGALFQWKLAEAARSLGYAPERYDLWPVAALLLLGGLASGAMGSLWAAIRLK